jgi:hypothetical protein
MPALLQLRHPALALSFLPSVTAGFKMDRNDGIKVDTLSISAQARG